PVAVPRDLRHPIRGLVGRHQTVMPAAGIYDRVAGLRTVEFVHRLDLTALRELLDDGESLLVLGRRELLAQSHAAAAEPPAAASIASDDRTCRSRPASRKVRLRLRGDR